MFGWLGVLNGCIDLVGVGMFFDLWMFEIWGWSVFFDGVFFVVWDVSIWDCVVWYGVWLFDYFCIWFVWVSSV